MASKDYKQDFREGKHYIPWDGLEEWRQRQEDLFNQEQEQFKNLIREATREKRVVKCYSCLTPMSFLSKNVQMISTGGARCSKCRV